MTTTQNCLRSVLSTVTMIYDSAIPLSSLILLLDSQVLLLSLPLSGDDNRASKQASAVFISESRRGLIRTRATNETLHPHTCVHLHTHQHINKKY